MPKLISFLVVLCCCLTTFPVYADLSAQSASGKTLVIDGSKNPELFPQWYVWETFFQALPIENVGGPTLLRRELRVSDSEFVFLLTEARRFRHAEETLRTELRATRTALLAEKKTDEEIQDASKEVNLRYRQQVLDGRGRVHSTLGAESLQNVVAWIERRLSGTTLRLSGKTLEYFRQPW